MNNLTELKRNELKEQLEKNESFQYCAKNAHI